MFNPFEFSSTKNGSSRPDVSPVEVKGHRSRIFKYLKGAASFILVTLLVWKVDFTELVGLVSDLDPVWIGPFLGTSVIMISLRALKQKILLADQGFNVGICRLSGIILSGYFFNNFLPSMVGGDLARGYILGRFLGSNLHAFASVFLERFTGLLALMTLAASIAVFNLSLLQDNRIAWIILGCFLCSLILVVLVMHPQTATRLRQLLPRHGFLRRPLEMMEKLHTVISSCREKPWLITKTLVISIVFHFVTCVNTYLACRCLRLELEFLMVALIVPIVLVVTLLPLTPNNIGLWEWAFYILLPQAGAGGTAAVAVALLLRAKNLLLSLIGALTLAANKPKVAENMSGGS